jgi:hypothetical protein
MKYRIKIVELNNGDISYIPQVLKINIENKEEWCSIYDMFNEKMIFEHFINFVHYDSEIQALKIIEKHKQQVELLKSFEIKKITYKEIE